MDDVKDAGFAPVEVLPAAAAGNSPFLLVCDHARNHVPAEIHGGDLGLPAEEMARHIAYDVGARGLTLGLAQELGAAAVLSTVSRLVIDPNRGEDDPTLIMQLYDRTIVPANRRLDPAERERRLEAYHRPYHRAITAMLDAMLGAGQVPLIVSLHSFTPQLQGRPPRPWHIGLLWDRDDRLLRPLVESLAETAPDLVVGDNEPYSGQLAGDCMSRHGTERGLPHVLIEVRNDLIANEADQAAWAARLAPHLMAAAAAFRAKG